MTTLPGAAAPDVEAVGARLQAVVDRTTARRRRGGHVVAGVATLDGRFSWSGAAGEARPGVPMTPQTPYFIASVTKLVIATTVMRLVERGDIDLDNPIGAHLPDTLVGGLHTRNGVDHTSRITIRSLLGHTSGLPDFLEDAPKGGRSWYADIGEGADRTWTLEEAVARARELEAHFAPRDLSARRVRARYSDTGFQLLIAVVERARGRAFGEVVAETIARPLDMRQTWQPGRAEPIDPAPEPADVYGRGHPVDIPLAFAASNDLVSTIGDNLRFMRALVGGEVFDEPATFGLMTARWNLLFPPFIHYGLGVMRFRVNRLASPTRRPLTLVGHSGSTGSWLFHCPELDLVLAGSVDEVGGYRAPFGIMPRLLRVAADATP